MSIDLAKRVSEDVTIVEISGKLVSTVTLRDQLSDVVNSGSRRIIVEMSRVSYIDSGCLGELVAFAIAAGERATVKFLHLKERARNILKTRLLNTVFEIYDDEAFALHSFPSTQSSTARMPLYESRSEYFLG